MKGERSITLRDRVIAERADPAYGTDVRFTLRSRPTATLPADPSPDLRGPDLPGPELQGPDLAARQSGYEDALRVSAGERVVRAILAHRGVPMYQKIWPDLDHTEYLVGYMSAPGSMPPSEDRSGPPPGGYHGPLRRHDDTPNTTL